MLIIIVNKRFTPPSPPIEFIIYMFIVIPFTKLARKSLMIIDLDFTENKHFVKAIF